MACRIFLRLLAVFGFCLISALAIGDDEPDPQNTEFPRQLEDVVPWLDAQVESVRDLDDYSCIMHVRERLGELAELTERKFCAKVRHKPFSIFLADLEAKPSDVWHYLYVEGENEERILVGQDGHYSGSHQILRNGYLAKHGRRYCMLEYVLTQTLTRTRDWLKEELKHGGWNLGAMREVKLGDDQCYVLCLNHPTSPAQALEVWWNCEVHLPVRFVKMIAPRGDDVLQLIEDYTYLKVKPDCALTDEDFDERNPDYFFHPPRSRRNPVCEAGTSDRLDSEVSR